MPQIQWATTLLFRPHRNPHLQTPPYRLWYLGQSYPQFQSPQVQREPDRIKKSISYVRPRHQQRFSRRKSERPLERHRVICTGVAETRPAVCPQASATVPIAIIHNCVISSIAAETTF